MCFYVHFLKAKARSLEFHDIPSIIQTTLCNLSRPLTIQRSAKVRLSPFRFVRRLTSPAYKTKLARADLIESWDLQARRVVI